MARSKMLLAVGLLLASVTVCRAGGGLLMRSSAVEQIQTAPVRVQPVKPSGGGGLLMRTSAVEAMPAEPMMKIEAVKPGAVVMVESGDAGAYDMGCHGGGCCGMGKCRKLLEWLCYKPIHCHCKGQAPCCTPPLYTFFLCCDGCGRSGYACGLGYRGFYGPIVLGCQKCNDCGSCAPVNYGCPTCCGGH